MEVSRGSVCEPAAVCASPRGVLRARGGARLEPRREVAVVHSGDERDELLEGALEQREADGRRELHGTREQRPVRAATAVTEASRVTHARYRRATHGPHDGVRTRARCRAVQSGAERCRAVQS
eukprot:4576331-Prymnesium_polylepis.3